LGKELHRRRCFFLPPSGKAVGLAKDPGKLHAFLEQEFQVARGEKGSAEKDQALGLIRPHA